MPEITLQQNRRAPRRIVHSPNPLMHENGENVVISHLDGALKNGQIAVWQCHRRCSLRLKLPGLCPAWQPTITAKKDRFMQKILLIAATLLFNLTHIVSAHADPAAHNEAITGRYFSTLGSGTQPKLAELSLFFSTMPKGGDLHHHYSGAIYAEQYLDWVERAHYCINKMTFRIETDPAQISAERAKEPQSRTCLAASEVLADNAVLRDLLQHWSDKDYGNHFANELPPDRQFFDTFAYFDPISSNYSNEGLQLLKKRAIAENLLYIETMFKLGPMVRDAGFDASVSGGVDQATLTAQMSALMAKLEQDQDFRHKLDSHLADLRNSSAGIDDAQFTMRYQTFVLRMLAPSQVFSSLVGAFKEASESNLVVGVNIVGPENLTVSMRDYALHMQMFRFLKAKYPGVKLSLHAGELALGMVRPEGLSFHIRQAVEVAGADRIGHGIDLVHETDAVGLLEEMHRRAIAVEVNLSSNEFILGVKNEAHPVTLYRKFGVPFVLATDDAGVSRNNLTGEYVLYASRYQTSYAEMKKLSYDSVRYSFLAETDKQRLIKDLDARFVKFEAQIAAMVNTLKRN